ncbi:MAG: alpha/beta fold hydrolase [Polymorphobacter sp.]|uniref:alpha/beta fold hydrolase n=1 Tax=Polymorphobacter sp. TaxID=1909290 RepID=UPI003A86A022
MPAAEIRPHQDGWFWSQDNLRLHYREWPGDDPARPALLCLPGLTRTAADFEGLAAHLAGRWRLIAPDLRGRGESAWPRDSLTYVPLTYLLDLGRLLDAAAIRRFVVIGNSLGGHLAMQLTTGHRAAMAGAVLNDIGPVLETEGLARLRANVGRAANWLTWVHAARDLQARNHAAHPDWTLRDWLAQAHRLCRLSSSGRVVFNYDPRIADALRLPGANAGVNLWAAFKGLTGLPVLSLRGVLSDVFSPAAQQDMAARLPDLMVATVPRVGHAPTLTEPAALQAIDTLLALVLEREHP